MQARDANRGDETTEATSYVSIAPDADHAQCSATASSKGTLAGIVVGTIALLAIIDAVVILHRRRWERQRHS
jgi:hypothetical protein